MTKRILLFVLTNLAIMLTLIVGLNTLETFGFLSLSSVNSLNLKSLLIYSLIIGFSGSFISLLLSKYVAKWSVNGRTINDVNDEIERKLLSMVTELSMKVNIKTPELIIYESNEINAFATGAFKNSALVAVSTKLLLTLDEQETKAVIAHEIAHIANGDMVTMTLLQGLINTFVIGISKIISITLSKILNTNVQGIELGINLLCQVIFGYLGMIITSWFSRKREFTADADSAKIYDKYAMISALQKINNTVPSTFSLPHSLQCLGFNSVLNELFSTHPKIEDRIKALENQLVLN